MDLVLTGKQFADVYKTGRGMHVALALKMTPNQTELKTKIKGKKGKEARVQSWSAADNIGDLTKLQEVILPRILAPHPTIKLNAAHIRRWAFGLVAKAAWAPALNDDETYQTACDGHKFPDFYNLPTVFPCFAPARAGGGGSSSSSAAAASPLQDKLTQLIELQPLGTNAYWNQKQKFRYSIAKNLPKVAINKERYLQRNRA